jgi:RNA polymerase sigma-70 factor (ECF subfamily)
MGDSPSTRPSLLLRVRDSRDGGAWAQFVAVYGPLIYGFGRKQGLQDADAADLTQETLRVVAGSIKSMEYDPTRGTFRSWLFQVVRHRLYRFRDRQARPGQGSGDSGAHDLLHEVPGREADPARLWEEEYERRQFAWAAEQVRGQVQETTWQAFWRTAVEGQGGQQVAQALGISVAAVYLAKGRVMARLKDEIRQLQGTD